MMNYLKTYSEMCKFNTYQERLDYLYIGDKIGHQTFGSYRYLNQRFYSSKFWLDIKDQIIIRDSGCDLGVDGCFIQRGKILVHHINPITIDDIVNLNPCVIDPENLICTVLPSHNYIHFGTKTPESLQYKERTPNDTCPWKK